MATLQATVTTKGQVTLPKPLREALSIRAGDKLEFTSDSNNQISIRKKNKAGSSAGSAQKFLKSNQPPVSGEQVKEVIQEHMRMKYGDHRSKS